MHTRTRRAKMSDRPGPGHERQDEFGISWRDFSLARGLHTGPITITPQKANAQELLATTAWETWNTVIQFHGKEAEKDSSESEGSDDDEEMGFENDGDMSDIEFDDDDDEVMDFEDEGDFEGDIDLKDAFKDPKEARAKKRKQALGDNKPSKKSKKNGLEGLFAPAEEFAEILEETGSSKQKPGMHSSLSNKENAAHKQLDWEKKRDMWVRGQGSFAKKGKNKGKWKGKPNKNQQNKNNHNFNRKKAKK